jgi:hypothetical protein
MELICGGLFAFGLVVTLALYGALIVSKRSRGDDDGES